MLIKQRVFSWTDTYDVYDENGRAKYFVKAEFLTLGHRLHVYDAAGLFLNGKRFTFYQNKYILRTSCYVL